METLSQNKSFTLITMKSIILVDGLTVLCSADGSW